MRKVNKYPATKHGASSIFLAIIMSALILVECTFLAFVWNLDYALSVNTALKTEIDMILSDYDRQLFSCYGIYAFSMDKVDDECFRKALEINGLDTKSTLYSSGTSKLTAEDLKKAINSYFWYRNTGIGLSNVVDAYSDLILQLDETGVLKKIGQYMKSPAAGYVTKLIKGSESVEEWVSQAQDTLDIDDLTEKIDELDSIKSDFSDVLHDSDIGLDVDIANWESFIDTLSTLERFVDYSSDNTDAVMSKLYTANYCSHNFDCWLPPKDDASINGTPFKSIHGDKKSDCEYIITGRDDAAGLFEVYSFTVHVLIAANILKDYANPEFRNTMEVLGQIISSVILAISEGTVDIDYRIIAAGLTLYISMFQATSDFRKLVKGERVTIFKYEDVDLVTFNYRDFLFLFCICIPEEKLLERSLTVLERDFGELYKGIKLETDFRGSTYSLEKSYQLYE